MKNTRNTKKTLMFENNQELYIYLSQQFFSKKNNFSSKEELVLYYIKMNKCTNQILMNK